MSAEYSATTDQPAVWANDVSDQELTSAHGVFYIAGASMDTVMTSWRRLSRNRRRMSGPAAFTADRGRLCRSTRRNRWRIGRMRADRLPLPTAPVRILMVYDDLESSGSLRLMLRVPPEQG